MMKLKPGQERFVVVDGPLAGREYVPGGIYDDKDVPDIDKARFERIAVEKSAKNTAAPVPEAAKGGADKS